ncbi:MAG: transglycosylase SLT domain-containing protein [Gemmatimonadetes bacterium]|nr:transglycosylase SLT domain-containing protein [Gemmatimonadota bacterium]
MHPSVSRIALITAGFLLVGTPVAGQRPPVPAAPVARDLTPAREDVRRLPAPAIEEVLPAENSVEFFTGARFHGDVLALERFRPGYRFWTHVFSHPDGSIVFGSAETGALLASFPARGDWAHEGRYSQEGIEELVADRSFPRRLGDRRDHVAEIIEPFTGPVIHNPTRGNFVSPNVGLYGGFLEEWGRIYERFGVPADLGLAQALVESGFSGDVKSEARAIGFCQFLPRNWQRLDRLTDHVIEVENQTTQAAYCAAYLAVLATKYGSFVPALSEHHAGSTNVGRTVINGTRMGGEDVRERYLLGAQFAKEVRALSPRTFRDVVGTYGPRSYLYAEMIFGNMETVADIRDGRAQETIHAMRVDRDVSLSDIVRRTGISEREVKRFNPALVRRVPRGATLYLPEYREEFGRDVAFWHRDAGPDYQEVLYDFLQLGAPLEDWDSPAFEAVLDGFRQRFRATETEEGRVMDAVIGYVIQEIPLLHRQLSAYRTDPEIDRLFERGMQLRAEDARDARR